MDFGDAQELSHGHKPVLAGTTRWTAPEIFNKEPWTGTTITIIINNYYNIKPTNLLTLNTS